MMDSWSDYNHRQTIQPQTQLLQEQLLYSHLLDCARVEAPAQLIDRFRMLFIHAAGYPDHHVWTALKQLIESPFIERDFKFILNRICYIFINHWLMQPRCHGAIQELIDQFDCATVNYSRSRTTYRIRYLVQQFKGTEQYAALKRLARLLSPGADTLSSSKPLGTLVRRYPCLYEANLLTKDSTDEQRRQVRYMRRQMQRQFERNLARYATHHHLGSHFSFQSESILPSLSKVRSARMGGGVALSQASNSPGQPATSLRNPTLLTDCQIDWALIYFGGKIDGSNTYRDLAHRFLTYTRHTPSFGAFKDDLYQYLVETIDPRYGDRLFKPRLYQFLEATLPEHRHEPLTEVLFVQTCRRLLQMLVVDNSYHLNHALFVDLAGNLGTTATIGLLLKIVLICRGVKPYLEGQLAILFQHYESHASEAVNWLIQVLENFNIALSLNFGTLKLYQGSSPAHF
ncbi:hypothetical protein [Leptolyngbya ohadii]|uniref:hypothetical protein n=1 Tax=Leptolyngbya ohadii TaxID=1962290 RepID=UPI00117AADE4|nr:hypothetical protein [Leptolyngbya ohadii]